MRTVSFSSDPVRHLLNSDFVCATINIEGDPTSGASLAHAPTDSCGPSSRGIGRCNVQCLFLTPQGEILHVASGYVGPKDLAKEIRFAESVFKAVRKTPDKAKPLVASMHARRLKELGFSDAAIQSRKPPTLAGDITNRVFGRNGLNLSSLNRRGITPRQMTNFLAQRRAALLKGANSRMANASKMLNGNGDEFHASGNSGIFASFGSRSVKGDHQFSMDHPLYPMSDFLENPRVLVGNEQTAYGSVGPGGASGGTIGGNGNTRMQYRQPHHSNAYQSQKSNP